LFSEEYAYNAINNKKPCEVQEMKKKGSLLTCIFFAILIIFLMLPSLTFPADMRDYCAMPPYVTTGIKPNLLLMIDNSASMFDLTYIDKGNLPTRQPFYCYDQTYKFGQHYTGYFQDWFVYYEYDFTNNYFYKTNFTQADFLALSCDKNIPGSLCITGTNLNNTSTPKTVTRFVAEGNYLNWLTASKFDVEKMILTGGKYNTATNNLLEETRGCVGRRFIKEPITQQSYTEGGTNTPLGLTFAVKGPNHPYSETLLSPGGQTYLEIYAGNYNESNCQTAVTDIINGENKNTITNDIELCLNYDAHGQYCSLDMFTSCTSDADCAGTPGTCDVVNDGVCTAYSDGVCSVDTSGTCTANNGTCSSGRTCVGGSNAGAVCNNNNQCDSGVCSKTCTGGGKAGAECNNDNDCKYNSCTAGKVGSTCSANSDCDLKKCTAGLVGNLCVANSDCNSKSCSAPAAKVGTVCTVNTDCNTGSGTCSAGNVGATCTTDIECGIGYKGVCQKPVTQQIKSTYGQSVHECYDYWNNGSLSGNNWWTMMTNPQGCNQIYKELFTCRGGSRDAKLCVVPADCPGGTCINGPEAIRQGSPILICGPGYVGYCATSSDNWATTTWVAREYTAGGGYTAVENCVKAKFEAYCGDAQVPPVTDPSDDPSSTEKFDNLPAIIGDMGIGAQLGDPIKTLTVDLYTDTAPTGLIQEFEGLIYLGVMTFNYFGSSTECPANMPCTKICSIARSTCMVNADCPIGDSCVTASNLDGSKIISYIRGNCSSTTTTYCTRDEHCLSGEKCVFSIGDHSSGLINSIDNIFASTWTPFSEGFYNAIGYFAQRTDKRLNGTDFITEAENTDYKNPVQFRCQENNILLVTDGMSTADLNANVVSDVSTYNDGDGQIDNAASTCPKYAGSRNLDDMAWIAQNRNIKDFTQTPTVLDRKSETVITHVVFNGVASTDPGECNPDTLLQETANNGGGTYQRAEDPQTFYDALRATFLQIVGRASSGAAASVLASGEGSGANLVQAVFYPRRRFFNSTIGSYEEIEWTGRLSNFWYYVDPFFKSSAIYEDNASSQVLNLTNDDMVTLYFDPNNERTMARRYVDTNSDGVVDSLLTPDIEFEKLKALWEAGVELWKRDISVAANKRKIYTTLNGTSLLAGNFSADALNGDSDNANSLRPWLDLQAVDSNGDGFLDGDLNRNGSVDDDDARILIRYIHGEDFPAYPWFRSRTVAVDLNNDGDTLDTVNGISESPKVWKLADILNSTPKISSWIPLNIYDSSYADTTYGEGTSGGYINTANYKSRGMVFTGGNDGMLHAFKLGTLTLKWVGQGDYEKAQLTGSDLGKEVWAFIPKNALPYFKYIPNQGYCHIYSIDLSPYVFDASIGEPTSGDISNNPRPSCPDPYNTATCKWRTILIGGMRYGGACRDETGACNSTTDGLPDCVKTPVTGKGYSSYFALDITDQNNPTLLWEFSSNQLGFTTTGPAVVRIGPDNLNGKWFVVFGSGPTGPISTTEQQFLGRSDQNLKFFVLDLKTGTQVAGSPFDTGIQNAFAGSMLNSTFDSDLDYQDDAIYVGYVTKAADNTWTQGGVLRILTKESDTPSNWVVSKVMENTGPVTSSVVKLQNNKTHNLWLFFGTGRYYYEREANVDDPTNPRSLFGVKEPCFTSANTIDTTCTSPVSGTLEDVTTNPSATPEEIGDYGWHIDLEDDGSYTYSEGGVSVTRDYLTERVITDPLATSSGLVFFTTYKPYDDVCLYGGKSFIWAVRYNTGGAAGALLKGVALLQVSTGSIEQIDLSTAFANTAEGKWGRRTTALEGVPPTAQGLSIMSTPPPVKKVIHMRER
jgi:type IV pilus assembly protein PilY1